MSEPRKADRSSQMIALGVVFFSVGAVFLTALKIGAAGIPFLVLGIAFFAWGQAEARKAKSGRDGEPG
jgi:hypothetical protein